MPEANDILINLSFSMHSGPGTFALLLGSGISQGAGIPTGWDIVLDLIRRLATLEGEPDIDNPEQWFEGKYQEPPKYSFLIEKVAPSPIARRNILKHYIEPTDEEREQGLKVPSQAHKSIAQLVKNGTIRVILTTNIDQLLETALKEEGVAPVVIFNDDSLEGAMPYVHSECTIIKLHGDYLDTRIKNTPDELAQYSEKMNAYLDRIFEEFGLVVCGWSANWDTALRDALYRRHNWRFSTYWAYRNDLNADATQLRDHLQAILVSIDDADSFFSRLSGNVDALRKFEQPHPLSVPLAIAQVKKYVVEDKYRIQLHDLIYDEIDKLIEELKSDRFIYDGQSDAREFYQEKILEYEKLSEILIAICCTLGHFDNEKNGRYFSDAIQRLVNIPAQGDLEFLDKLRWYPALLFIYTTGILSIKERKFDYLYTLMQKPVYYKSGIGGYRKESVLNILNVWKVFGEKSEWIPQKTLSKESLHFYDFFYQHVKKIVRPFIRSDHDFYELFNVFECVVGLEYIYLNQLDNPKVKRDSILLQPLFSRELLHFQKDPIKRSRRKIAIPPHVIDNLDDCEFLGKNCSLIKTGLFGRENAVENFKSCRQYYQKLISDYSKP